MCLASIFNYLNDSDENLADDKTTNPIFKAGLSGVDLKYQALSGSFSVRASLSGLFHTLPFVATTDRTYI